MYCNFFGGGKFTCKEAPCNYLKIRTLWLWSIGYRFQSEVQVSKNRQTINWKWFQTAVLWSWTELIEGADLWRFSFFICVKELIGSFLFLSKILDLIMLTSEHITNPVQEAWKTSTSVFWLIAAFHTLRKEKKLFSICCPSVVLVVC